MGKQNKAGQVSGTFTYSSSWSDHQTPTDAGGWLPLCLWLSFITQIQPSSMRPEDAEQSSNSVSNPLGNFKFKPLGQMVWSFVTISTRTIWSKELQTQSPLLSGLQSKLEMG